MSKKTIKVKWIKSASGRSERQRLTVRGLGLTRLNQVRELEDTPAIRGMVHKVCHLVSIVE